MARFLAVMAVVAVVVLVLPESGGERSAAVGHRGEASARAAVTERPAGTLVTVTDANRLVAVDVATGRRTARRMRSLAGCGPQLVITGGHVVFAGAERGRTIVLSLPLSLEGRPARLGAAHAFVPSSTPGRVWLAGTICTRDRMDAVREVAVDGLVTRQARRRVPGSWLAAATNGGLVVHRGEDLRLWDPRTGSQSPLAVKVVMDAHGDLIAGCAAETGCSQLLLVDLATGRRVTARPERGSLFGYAGELSPDGALLAVQVNTGSRWRIALIDTADGAVELVRGTRLSSTHPELTWSASSGWLFFRGRDGRVGAIRPGSRRAVDLPFRLPRYAFGFAAG